jgi:hypothetical protein
VMALHDQARLKIRLLRNLQRKRSYRLSTNKQTQEMARMPKSI